VSGANVIDDATIREILSDYPRGAKLYAELACRFGRQLLILEESESIFSTYNFGIDDAEYPVALVRLVRGTGREAAALCHELLHIKIYSDGFALPYDFEASEEIDKEASGVVRHNLSAFFNAIDHLTFIDQFLELGFQRDEFLSPYEADLIESVKSLIGYYSRPEFIQYVRGIRNLFFATEYLTDKLNGDFSRSRALSKGFKPHFSDSQSDFASVRTWFRRGTFTDVARRAKALDRLLSRLGVPRPLYYQLEFSSHGVRLRDVR